LFDHFFDVKFFWERVSGAGTLHGPVGASEQQRFDACRKSRDVAYLT
jgi:hypothetical protein